MRQFLAIILILVLNMKKKQIVLIYLTKLRKLKNIIFILHQNMLLFTTRFLIKRENHYFVINIIMLLEKKPTNEIQVKEYLTEPKKYGNKNFHKRNT